MQTFIKQNINLFKVYLVGIITLTSFRLIFLLRFGESGIVSNYTLDIIRAFVTGFRFDTQVLCYTLILPFLISFLLLIRNDSIQKFIIKFSKYYFIIVFSLLILILIVDQQYYTYFQSHLNILIYGFLEDDTQAVTTSIWTDHPVIIVSIIYILLIFGLVKVLNRIYSSNAQIDKTPHIAFRILFIPLMLGLLFLGIRGSIGIFPLQIDDSTVSENRFINTLALNGLFTLEKAVEERAESRKPVYRKDVLKNTPYGSIKEVLAKYHNKNVEQINDDFTQELFLTTDTNKFLERNPPNVVFILMESFGGYYLKYHSDQLNLLGSLKQHISEDYLFTNFLSATQGTIFSLEHIMINKDYPLISATNKRFNSYQSSIAYPYKQAGYETIFITGGKLGWRNLQEFVPNQYFDEAYGQATITKKQPNALTNTWGVYDEVLLEEIYHRLNENTDKPKLIFVLTTTNHTPYELPDSYKGYPINMPDSLDQLIMANKHIAEANFGAYQYANDCLGKFISKLKTSEVGKNTIVAASGDHNSYALFPLKNSNIAEADNYKVPFYLYIPEGYKPQQKTNLSRCGSHKDIFPTLINLSLPNQTYFSLGDNLFDTKKPDSLFFGVNQDFNLGHPDLSKTSLTKKAEVRALLNKYYFAEP